MEKYGRWMREIDYSLQMKHPYLSLNLDVRMGYGQQQMFLDVCKNMSLLTSLYGMLLPIHQLSIVIMPKKPWTSQCVRKLS
jgi:hypothetical protein